MVSAFGAGSAGAGFAGAGFAGAVFFFGVASALPAEDADSPLAPMVSFRPGWISDGSSPTTSRLSSYSFSQPPLTFWVSAILAR